MTHRVVQWTTGNVGRRSVRAVVAHPDLELVGCYAWSADKVGRDVGALCGIDPVGLSATDDVDALLALRPDCVLYNPMWPDVDELVRILEAGVDVVSTAAFINGRALGADRYRIVYACQRGRSTMFGTGISPGFVELIGIATALTSDLSAAQRSAKGKFFIHGERDEICPLKDLREFYAHAAEPKELVVIDGADHVFDGKVSQVSDAIEELLGDWTG